jgi:prepilin peptidase CpaA
MTTQEWVAVAVGLAACVADLRTRRIPNVLTFSTAVAGVLFHAIGGGIAGAGQSLAGLAVGLLLFLPFYLLGGLGAGDVKLLAALGAWLGPRLITWAGIYGMIAGGVLALGVALGRGYLRQLFRNLYLLLAHWRVSGVRRFDALTLEHGAGPRLAYAVPITIGVGCAVWLR